jgi:ABC-type antimicrobial peptide transport system permease subunit
LRNHKTPARIVGIVADVDDEHVARAPAMTLYYPFKQFATGPVSRLFVRTSRDPHDLLPAVTKVIRELSPDNPVERPRTLEEVRVEMLTPARLNALVVAGFAGVALLIAVVGVAGVLAFSVRSRTREFGVRLAVGSAPRQLLVRVLSEGASIAIFGIAAGAAVSYALAAVAAKYFEGVSFPGAPALLAAGTVLAVAAIIASLMPAARAARLDVLQALRSE